MRANVSILVVIALILIVPFSPWTNPNVQAQTTTQFSPADHFPIPSSNGTVSFSINGTFSEARFENGGWTFKNLIMYNSASLSNFWVSAKNSNVTIFSYLSTNTTIYSIRLRYGVSGNGEQYFNFSQTSQNGGLDWSVIKSPNNIFLSQGAGWTISNSGTIMVNAGTGNFTIVYYDYYGNNLLGSNLPFYQQHSVAINTVVVVAVVVLVTAAIAVINRRNQAKEKTGSKDARSVQT